MHQYRPCQRKKPYHREAKLHVWLLDDEKDKFEIQEWVGDQNHALFQHYAQRKEKRTERG